MMPWESPLGSKIWKNATAYFTFLRGCLRLGWKRHPIRIAVLNANRKQIPNPNKNGKKPTVWGFDCPCCGGTFPISEGQIDHIHPAGKLNAVEDIQGFVERLLLVTEKDLRLICKGCNNALAMSFKTGESFEASVATKKAIEIIKSKQDKEFLISRNVTPASNATKRREQIIAVLKGETN